MVDPERPRCGAHSRRTGEPCRTTPVRGSKRCRMHGGTVANKPGPRLKHGERSKYVSKAILPAVVAELAAIKADPSLPVATNLAERRVRRRGLPEDVIADLEAIGALDTHDRSDAALLLKAQELESAKAGPAAFAIPVVPVLPFVCDVRGPDGPVRAITDPDRPDAFLLRDPEGRWCPAVADRNEALGLTTWRLPLTLPEESK